VSIFKAVGDAIGVEGKRVVARATVATLRSVTEDGKRYVQIADWYLQAAVEKIEQFAKKVEASHGEQEGQSSGEDSRETPR
jgi:hypothetical protein